MFLKCKSLKTIEIPKDSNLQQIGDSAFYLCSFASITLPESCKTISVHSFMSCTKLTTIEHFISTIPANAFEDCISLTTFYVPTETTQIYPSAFIGCTKLTYFNVSSYHSKFCSIDGFLFNVLKTELIICPPGIQSVYMYQYTESLGSSSFSICTQVRKMSFLQCTKLLSFGSNIFSNCVLLSQIQFPPLLNSIGTDCFKGCSSLKTIVFPPLMKNIQSQAFGSCRALRKVIYCGNTPVSAPKDAFADCPMLKIIYVTTEYNSTTFSSINVIKQLSSDCILPNAFYNTCNQISFKIAQKFTLFTTVFLFSSI